MARRYKYGNEEVTLHSILRERGSKEPYFIVHSPKLNHGRPFQVYERQLVAIPDNSSVVEMLIQEKTKQLQPSVAQPVAIQSPEVPTIDVKIESEEVVNDVIDINDPALTKQTMAGKLHGVGVVTAGKVLAARNKKESKRFDSLEDLKDLDLSVNWDSLVDSLVFGPGPIEA